MPVDSTLFEESNGDPVTGFMLLKSRGGNVPPAWIERYTTSRKKKEGDLAKVLKAGFAGYADLLEWQEIYQKECFYYGIRALFEIERNGKTNY